jgi:hypothetical protein
MEYNKISGSNLNNNNVALFNLFEHEQCYLAFARANETWGTYTAINIALNPTEVLADVLGTGHFYDLNTTGYTETLSQITIVKTPLADADFDLTHSNPIAELENITLYLDYMNAYWVYIRNLPPNYLEFLSSSLGKYYIQAGGKTIKINKKTLSNHKFIVDTVSINIYSKNDSNFVFNWISGLSKIMTISGETIISGLTDAKLSLIDAPTIMTFAQNANFYFCLADSNNNKISETMYLQTYMNKENRVFTFYDTNETEYLLFQIENSTTNSIPYDYFLKVTYDIPINELAIFNESLPFMYPLSMVSSNVSDGNPPALDISYLKNPFVNTSLIEVESYVKIKKNQKESSPNLYSTIQYVTEIDSTTEYNKYLNWGFGGSNLNLQFIHIEMDVDPYNRFANVAPKPSGLPYTTGDTRIWLWTNNFEVGDVVNIKINPAITSLVNNVIPNAKIINVDYYFNFIDLQNAVGGNHIIIPSTTNTATSDLAQVVSTSTTSIYNILYASCNNFDDAINYNMDSVMINLKIPTTFYNGIYRQIAICFDPQVYQSGHSVLCSTINQDYVTNGGGISLLNPVLNTWTPGYIQYISNKNPIYRQFLTGPELFTLII